MVFQDEDEFVSNEFMRDFWLDVVFEKLLGDGWKEGVWDQICNVIVELFKVVVYIMVDKFNMVGKLFEFFVVDFLVDDNGKVWLLEVNEILVFYNYDKVGELVFWLMESVVFVVMEYMGKV